MLNELEEASVVERSIGDRTIRDEMVMQHLLYGSDFPFLPPWSSADKAAPPLSPEKLMSNSKMLGADVSRPVVIAAPEKGQSGKMESNYKYTLRIKSCGNGVADDGYKWRKYGQKSIKNSPNPRSYYRCTNPRCNAKRQVERSSEDPDMLIITYEGLHLHYYTYSHLSTITKKPKTNSSVAVQSDALHIPAVLMAGGYSQQQDRLLENQKLENSAMRDREAQMVTQEDHCSQGLLEDMVPLMLRKPFCSRATSSHNYNEPSHEASSPSDYSSSLCWTPETFHFAESALSSIV